MSRKPWEIPIQYNDDRFAEPAQGITHHSSSTSDDDEVRSERDIESLLNRRSREDVATNRTSDTTPLDYGRGPHDDELDVSDRDFKSVDEEPINYEHGEHDSEIDVDDDDELSDDELESADPEEAIDPYAND